MAAFGEKRSFFRLEIDQEKRPLSAISGLWPSTQAPLLKLGLD
jgi:hypothetical protein